MSGASVSVRTYAPPPVDVGQILRYMGCPRPDPRAEALVRECLDEALPCFTYRVCFCELPLQAEGARLDFGAFYAESHALAKHLLGCDRALLFAATVGLEIDRLIARYTHTSPARALCLQAIGAERIEALCDLFCDETRAIYQAHGKTLRSRFSPGYGDLPLELQRALFGLLDCPRRIGLTLLDTCLMSPTKSVTAIVGILPRENPAHN